MLEEEFSNEVQIQTFVNKEGKLYVESVKKLKDKYYIKKRQVNSIEDLYQSWNSFKFRG